MNFTKEKIYQAILSGAEEVMNNKSHLNKINVFPVADGDTGSNMYSTMSSIVLKSKLKQNIKNTLESIADSAIIGARGNSGIILAQYFNGLSSSIGVGESITLDEFITAHEKGVEFAYESIDEPVEGTILTVMKVFHENLKQNCDITIFERLEQAYIAVEKAVERTTEQLKVLKKSNVVDSGAKGYAYFLKGFVNSLLGKNTRKFTVTDDIDIDFDHVHEEINYRYCTEVLLNEVTDIDELKSHLKQFGDSFICAGNERNTRFHIHTDTPEKVFDLVRSYGKVAYQKVEDMFKQQDIIHNRKYKYALVTDSIADLPKAYVDKEQVHIIHLSILLENMNFLDKLTVSNDMFLALNSKYEATSSLPTSEVVEHLYRYLLDYYEQVLVLSVSSNLSGTYNVLNKMKEKVDSDRIHVIDTLQNSVSQGLLVYKSVELMKLGMSLEEVVQEIEVMKRRSKILVSIETIDPMIASGRLSLKAGKIAKKINLKPVITLDESGAGAISKIAFSRKGSLNKIMKHLKKVIKEKGIDAIALTYVDDFKLAKEIEERIYNETGVESIYVTESSSIIALGAGKGAIGIGYIERG